MSFSLTPKTAFPRPQSDGFPQGIQWQADGTPLGDRHVQTVDLVGFGSGGVTRDADTLTVNAPAAGGGGGGFGGIRQQLFSGLFASPGPYSLNAQFQSTNLADYVVMVNEAGLGWIPCLPVGSPNDSGTRTFSLGGLPGAVTITFSAGFSDGGAMWVKEFF